jgi:hypothetical protein
MARPTYYSDETLRKATEYLENYVDHGDAIPSVAGLSIVIGRSRSTIYEWAKDADKQEFSDILERINATQEKTALSKGLTGDFNSAIVKLLLGKHGYHDKVDQELTGANREPLTVGWVLEGVKPNVG